MIDEQKQVTFQGELNHFSVTLKIRDKNLIIAVRDSESFDRYHKVINQEFIDNQDLYFKANFECPDDLFAFITENFSKIVIEKGVLKFSYTIGMKKIVKDVIVELNKEEVSDVALAHLKIDKMKDQFAVQLQQKDERISVLKVGLQELANQFRQYKRGYVENQKVNQTKMEKIEDRLQRDQKNINNIEEGLQKNEKNIQSMINIQKNHEKQLVKDLQIFSPPQVINHQNCCTNVLISF